MTSRRLRPLALAGLLGLLLAFPAPVRASRVRDLSLTEMAAKAGPIFSGRVSGIDTAMVRGLPATRITFAVTDDVQGAPGESITLTLLGGERRGGLPYRVPGMPRFAVGEEWVLLAYPPSAAGLTSPVGLFQGAFRVQTGLAGDRTVTIPGSRRALAAELRRAGLTGGAMSAPGAAAAAPAASLQEGTTVPHAAFIRQLRDLVAGIPPAAAAAPSSAAGELAAAAAARGGGARGKGPRP